jgi:hypothetical protein
MNCSKCGTEFFQSMPNTIVNFIGIYFEYNFENDEKIRNNYNQIFAQILEKIISKKIIKLSDIQFTIVNYDEVICKKCGTKNYNDFYKNFCDDIDVYISKYIYTLINSISLRTINISINEAEINYQTNYFLIAKTLPFKYRKEKKAILRLLKVQDTLNTSSYGGAAGDIIGWILDSTLQNIFTFIFGFVVNHGIKLAKKKINEKTIKNKIKRYLQGDEESLKSIPIEDIIKYFNFPKDYIGSKEEIIEKIICKKAIDYKEELIEKVRNKIKGDD